MYPRLLIAPASAVIALALACTTPAATHQAEDASRATSAGTTSSGSPETAGAATDYSELAFQYSEQGRHDDAVAAATKNVALAPKDPNAYDTLGEILLAVIQFQDPYVGDDARLALALALEGKPGQDLIASTMLEQLSKSYRRSARSAHMRRTAEKALRERKP
jgi:tetratricopeptide (TPR) repeat protein